MSKPEKELEKKPASRASASKSRPKPKPKPGRTLPGDTARTKEYQAEVDKALEAVRDR